MIVFGLITDELNSKPLFVNRLDCLFQINNHGSAWPQVGRSDSSKWGLRIKKQTAVLEAVSTLSLGAKVHAP
jgi:hypothetical protein